MRPEDPAKRTRRNELPVNEDPTVGETKLQADRAADAADEAELAKFGYLQQLRRSLSGFSSFAVSFSMISITTGIFANFGSSFAEVGPALVWSWLAAVVGQLLVGLVLCELAMYYPLSGYGYQWASRLVNPRFGFWVGWLLLLQFLTGFPGICQTLAVNLHPIVEANWKELYGQTAALPLDVPWLTVVIITVTALIHCAGIRFASLLNSAGAATELLGVVLLSISLLAVCAWNRLNGLEFLFEARHAPDGGMPGLQAWSMSLLMGAWCLTGFEAAADLAEETHRPRWAVPRAVLGSLGSSGIAGTAMLCALILCITNLAATQASDTPISAILSTQLDERVIPLLLLLVCISIFNCGVASMAHTTRLIFSLARDNMLPGSKLLKTVHPRAEIPLIAIIAVWAISSLVVLQLSELKLITSIATVAGYMGYGAMVLTALWGLRGKHRDDGFRLGRFRLPIAAAALAWTVLVVLALTAGAGEYGRLSARTTLVGLIVGAAIYFGLIRARIVRGEAGPPDQPPSAVAP